MCMSMAAAETLVRGLARLLQDAGDLVLDGSSTLTLLTSTLQHLTQVFEQHLGSRNQNRGFVALPSHPAETAAILQAQFLFDVLQKTHSLKLVHVPNCVLQSAVKIFPFKSLRHLELRSVPPHCLRGLRFVYSQLESLTCCKCISTLEEIISACGGDLSCALPWLELQTMNFSYNSITTLDDSLQLLNALKVLDLSHNKIQDCEHYLTTLTELEYLNLAYNFLSKVPNLGIFSRSKLVTLILRNNELDNINGVEQLVNLQHLDVAYNLLLEHAQLAPLSTLHYLKKLHLEGNPIWFHQNHRSAALVHVSPRAAFSNHLPRLVQSVSQSIHTSTSEKTALDRSALESSCAADFSDSQSPSENVAIRVPRKKSKGKVKVRRASISEPSDTEHEPQALPFSAGLVLEHQKEMKRLASFRDRFGADWLQYKRHLEEHDQVPVMSRSRSAEEIADRPAVMDLQNESSDPEQEKPQISQEGSSPALDGTVKEEEPEVQLDEPVEGEHREEEEADELMLGEEEEEKVEVDLCQPVLVSQIEGEGDPEPDWIFLRITAKHVIEVELKAARVLHKLELKCLKNVETSELTWKRMDLERVFPVLTLHFSYIRKDRQKRKYVVLDDCPEQCLQVILEVLSPAVEENRRNQDQEKGSMKLQCLKCKREFSQSLAPWHQGSYPSELGDTKILETLVASDQGPAASGEPIACPSCSSDLVVILPSEECSSTPLPPGADSTSEDLSDSVLEGGSQQEGPEETSVLASESGKFYIGGEDSSDIDTSNSTRTPELSTEPGTTLHPSSHGSDGGCGKEQGVKSQYLSLSHTDTNGGSLMGSYHYSVSRGPTPSSLSLNSESEETWNLSPSVNSVLNARDFRAVDHRLKLYLDMEVFEENAEEFQCFLKVAMVKFGRQGEFLSILVASDVKIYVLEVTRAIRGQPADWLKKNDSHYLSDISHLEVGLCHQSLRMEFENPKTSYNLLIRNQSCCDQFLQTLTDLMQELPAKHRSKVKEIPTVEMNPQHWLWPLLDSKTTDSAAAGDTSFFYLLAYLIQGTGDLSSQMSHTC
uniref:Serine/threonine-protein kinase 11-interacting protein n=1 Tax=Catharus ustulatus TaxID=91951 RepID=A0A8C3VKP4_CATUS